MHQANKWRVQVVPDAEKSLTEMAKNGALSENDILTIRLWAKTILKHGPEGVRMPGSIWMDHELSAEWVGHRASSFSSTGRIIYRIDENVVRVSIVKVTPSHDYTKGKKK